MDTIARLRSEAMAIYRAGVRAADPEVAVAGALPALGIAGPVWLIAVGKASRAMASAASRVVAFRGGLIITTDGDGAPLPNVVLLSGDHPEPGARSREAAEALGRVVGSMGSADRVLVLLSGGTSSLVGAPALGLSDDDYLAAVRAAGLAGLPIRDLNRIRKRLSRWGGGRLTVALGGRPVDLLAVSDILDDDLTALGSGPCTADPTPLATTRALLDELVLAAPVRRRINEWLATPNAALPDAADPAFAQVRARIVASNRIAVLGAAGAAVALEFQVQVAPEPIEGEAAEQGRRFAAELASLAPRTVLVAGGETTVTLGPVHGQGGRCQEFALAAAQRLSTQGRAAVILAAGTDGRDGPTDAAGAAVDPSTWPTASAAGFAPLDALASHDVYPPLERCGALLKTGPTGTNVADLLIGVIE